jgi:excisionase family DNA binding protein
VPSEREFSTWLTTSEAAERIGRTRQGVVWLCENGRLHAVRTKLGWLIDPKALERFARGEN